MTSGGFAPLEWALALIQDIYNFQMSLLKWNFWLGLLINLGIGWGLFFTGLKILTWGQTTKPEQS